MSYRHMHITGFLVKVGGVDRFIEAASRLDFFRGVYPIRRDDGAVIAVALYSKDLDGISDELDMADECEKLSGLLDEDIVIASAWQHPDLGRSRETSWLVRGTGRNAEEG